MSNVVRFERTSKEQQPALSSSDHDSEVGVKKSSVGIQLRAVPGQYRKIALGVSILLACLILRAAWISWAWEKTDNAYVEADVVPVSARIMGYVREIRVEQNQSVGQGEVIAVLDDSDLFIERGVKQARLKKAESDFHRGSRLMGTQALARADFEGVEAQYALAKADLAATELKMEFTQVKAPATGVIAKVQAHSGQFVQPGQAVVTLVAGAEKAWIKANFKETQVHRIRSGQRVRLFFDAYPRVAFDGQVDSIFPSSGSVLSLLPAENATGNFTRVIQRIPVKVSVVPQARYPLRPGMSASVEVDVQSGQ